MEVVLKHSASNTKLEKKGGTWASVSRKSQIADRFMYSDGELIARVVGGDPAAADLFVGRFGRFVLCILGRGLNLATQDAEEVFQQVWLRLWEDDYRRLRHWRGEGEFKSYLAILVRRAAYDYLRARSKNGWLDNSPDDSVLSGQFDPAALEPGADEMAAAAELRQATRSALARLNPRDRDLITRRHMQGQSYREIAEEMHLTVNNVGVALSRAEGRLRAIMIERYPDFVMGEEDSAAVEEAGHDV